MEIDVTKHLTIKLSGEDVDLFKTMIKKIADSQSAIGFRKDTLTDDEFKLSKLIFDKVKDN